MERKTYRALAKGYVDNRVVQGGEVFTTDKPKGNWMVELDPETLQPVEEPKKATPAGRKAKKDKPVEPVEEPAPEEIKADAEAA